MKRYRRYLPVIMSIIAFLEKSTSWQRFVTMDDDKILPVTLKRDRMAFKRSGVQFSSAPPSNEINRLGQNPDRFFCMENRQLKSACQSEGWDGKTGEVEKVGE